jgi:hypothetical protein
MNPLFVDMSLILTAVLGALGAANILLQVRKIDELIGLAAKLVRNHGWLRGQG